MLREIPPQSLEFNKILRCAKKLKTELVHKRHMMAYMFAEAEKKQKEVKDLMVSLEMMNQYLCQMPEFQTERALESRKTEKPTQGSDHAIKLACRSNKQVFLTKKRKKV